MAGRAPSLITEGTLSSMCRTLSNQAGYQPLARRFNMLIKDFPLEDGSIQVPLIAQQEFFFIVHVDLSSWVIHRMNIYIYVHPSFATVFNTDSKGNNTETKLGTISHRNKWNKVKKNNHCANGLRELYLKPNSRVSQSSSMSNTYSRSTREYRMETSFLLHYFQTQIHL